MTKEQQKVYATKRWKELRKQVIADEPVCHWCRRRPSTQADHIVELARGGDPYERTNLVGSCQPCNSRRGAEYQSRANAARRGAQRGQSGQRVFGADPDLTPPPLSVVSQTMGTDAQGSGPMPNDAQVSGRIEPRLSVPQLGHETFGPLVTAWAERNLPGELMAWQRLALDGQLQHDGSGQLDYSESLVSVARQNGKSYGMMALIGWWLTEMPGIAGKPQTVISAAHKLDRAFALFKELAPILEARFGGKINWSYGRNFVEFEGGTRWFVTAATPQNAHGASADLVCLDEIWSIGPEVIFDAYRPTMTARPNPLMSMWSTAGDESSKVMLQLREQAIHAIDEGRRSSLYFAEWSPPPGMPDGPEAWAWANPALGTTITVDRLRRMAETPNRQAFIRAHCNQWISAAQGWLPPQLWAQLEVDDPMPEGGVLAVDSDLTDLRYVGVRVAPRSDGLLQAAVAFVVESADQMWAEVGRVLQDKGVRVALTPGLASFCPVDMQRRMVTFGTQEMNLYTAPVRNMILERRLRHGGQLALAEQVNRAVAGRTGATITLSSQKSPGPIEMARCMVAAAGLAAVPTANVRKPMIGSAR